MYIEYMKAMLRSRQGWGWILALVGGAFACTGIFITVAFLSDIGSTITGKELLTNILVLNIYVPALPIGILCLVIGIWRINRKEKTPAEEKEVKRKSNLIWGWILVIFGGLFFLLVGWLGIDTINSYYIVENIGENLFVRFLCCSPLLVVGILLIIFGRRLILRTRI